MTTLPDTYDEVSQLRNTNAVLQLNLDTTKRQLAEARQELQEVRATLQATLREMDNAQRRYVDARAKLDAVPVDALRRVFRHSLVGYSKAYTDNTLKDDQRAIEHWLNIVDGGA